MISRIATWLAIVFGVVVVTLLTGVGVAAVLAHQGASEEWRTWSDVGQTFGVLSSIISSLALLAVVITARQNSAELARQRHFSTHNHAELRRTSHANLGMLHQNLLKMSIDDEELAAVWPDFDLDLPAATKRQFLYANLIYSFEVRALQSEIYTEAGIIRMMRHLFSSPVMRHIGVRPRVAVDTSNPKARNCPTHSRWTRYAPSTTKSWPGTGASPPQAPRWCRIGPNRPKRRNSQARGMSPRAPIRVSRVITTMRS